MSSVIKRLKGIFVYRARALERSLRELHRRAAKPAVELFFGGGYWLRLHRPPLPPSSNEIARYGHGHPPHERLSELLAKSDGEYERVLREFTGYADALLDISVEPTVGHEPSWRNDYLFGLDGVSLYCFTRARAPRRYLEIGSGNSTLFVDRARRDGAIDMEITSIDPQPRREIDSICDRVARQPLENADLEIFSELQAGDIVFMDGTHRVFMNSDPVVFFLDVLPELPPGVLVGIHDIHLPDDYLPEHTDRYYSEQYLLACYLLGESSWIRPVLPCWYVSHHPELGGFARSLTPWAATQRSAKARRPGVIFWLQIEPGANGRGPRA